MARITELRADDLSTSGMEGYLRWIIECGPAAAAPNIKETLLVLRVDDVLVPVVINNGATRGCWLTSLIGFYFREGGRELTAFIRPRIAGNILERTLHLLGDLLALGGMDRSVQVNNWLLTSNPPTRLSPGQLPDLIAYLERRFPDYLLVFSSVNRVSSGALIEVLERLEGLALTKRQLYFIDKSFCDCSKKRNVKSAIRLYRDVFFEEKSGSTRSRDHYEAVCDMYRSLYVRRYSAFNPHYTSDWFALVDTANWCESRYLYEERSGELAAFGLERTVGTDDRFFLLVGYGKWDRRNNPLRGAYGGVLRSFLASDARRLWLSAGADEFKMHLGAGPCLEYDVLLCRHLGVIRRSRARLLYYILSRLTDAYYRGIRKRLDLNQHGAGGP